MDKELYKDCQKDYEENLELFLNEKDEKYLQAIFIDFKTYCFNKIKQMRPFLKNYTIDEWSTDIVLIVFKRLKKKGLYNKEVWPRNLGAYLSWCCLGINNFIEKEENSLNYEILADSYNLEEEEGSLIMLNDKQVIQEDVVKWIIDEAIKMTVMNDGYSMLDVDRAVKLIIKNNGKIGRYSNKNIEIKNCLLKNINWILENYRGEN